MKENATRQETAAADTSVSIAWLLTVLLEGRRLIIGLTTAGILIALALVLMRRPSYTSEFSFLPQSTADPARGGLASLAGQFGISLGGLGGSNQPPQLYADLVSTREVLGPIARDTVVDEKGRRLSVSEYLGVTSADTAERRELTMLVLRQNVINTSVAARTTGAITVRVETSSRQASLKIAQALLDGINRFNRETRQSQAKEERRFAQERLDTARLQLRLMEDSLTDFLRANRQFSSASQLRFQQDRLESEVSLRRDVVRSLSEKAEEARIAEVRDAPVITMIERPSLPALRNPMRRVRTLAVWTMMSFFLSLVIVLGRAAWNRQRQLDGNDPAFQRLTAEWNRLGRLFRRG
jgi:uncharacterized protein involved in exopolysaccharide biosynthesis